MRDKPLLGLCPIGKFVFSHEDALRYKAIIEGELREWGIDFVGIDEAVKDGVIRGQDDVEPAVRRALHTPRCVLLRPPRGSVEGSRQIHTGAGVRATAVGA